MRKRQNLVNILFVLVLALNIGFWFYARPMRPIWDNVPPVPGEKGMAAFALNDRQFGYRLTGFMLQNLGNMGGRATPLREYNYDHIGQWLFLADKLDPVSNFTPLLAAYYFGATQDQRKLGPIIDYLATVGQRPGPDKWRWLAQAVYLARFRVGDMDKALALANTLASLWEPGLPLWMKQMPAFVLEAKGDKKEAYGMMLTILKDQADKMTPQDVNATIGYICEQILSSKEAATDPLCGKDRR
jgi:hypothetical protein